MRRLFVVACTLAALIVATACGSDSRENGREAVSDGAGALSKLAGGSIGAEVCGGRAAVAMGRAFASALSKTGEVNYADEATALAKAAEAAPEEIKDDFRVIAEAEAPFLRILGEADLTNYEALTANREYQEALAAMGSEEFKTATKNVDAWFDEHCK